MAHTHPHDDVEREPAPENNWVLRALDRATLHYGQVGVQHFSRRRLRRGIHLYARDREALERMAKEQPERGGRSLDDILDDQLRTARWAAWRVIIEYGLILDLPDDGLDNVEDSFTASALSLLLESDRTSARHRNSELPLEAAPPSVPPEGEGPSDAELRRAEEQRDAATRAAVTRLPPAERQVAEAILADPGAPMPALAAELGITEQALRQRFSRLLKRLTA
jgi:hypothetical protein